MSTEILFDSTIPEGAPELTALGKRLEFLRIERGISKQHLARHAGTSRQQLWRVMTGKSELTSSLKERLAGALSVDPSELSLVPASTGGLPASTGGALLSTCAASRTPASPAPEESVGFDPSTAPLSAEVSASVGAARSSSL